MAGCECCDNFSMIDGGDEFKAFPGLKGEDGKSAYQAAQEGGYTGTESQFNAALAEIDTALHFDDVDDELSPTSENPVQNKVITEALENVSIPVDNQLNLFSANPVENRVISNELALQSAELVRQKSAIDQAPTEETGQELLAEEELNTLYTEYFLKTLDRIFSELPQDESLSGIVDELIEENSWLDQLYREVAAAKT